MKLRELLQEAGLEIPNGQRLPDIELTGVSCDSRTVRRGELFVALRGLHHDGSRYIAEAFAKGSPFAVCERTLEGENTLLVPDARAALSALADAWYGHPARSLALIGVTGTNGKTSTASMLFWLLRRAGHHVGLIGTVECRCDETVLECRGPQPWANMTTPDPAELYRLLDRMRAMGAEYVVMEVTSHALALKKVAPLYFKRAIFTNLTPDHLDLHGDMESYFLEKSKLFSRCEQAVISALGSYGKRLCDTVECPFDVLEAGMLSAFSEETARGSSFTLLIPPDKGLAVKLPVAGHFMAENAALAILTARSLGIADGLLQQSIADFPGVRGRMERIADESQGIGVIVDYAHTPDALEKLLLAVRSFTPRGRVLLVFGCGGERDRSKRKEMGRIGSRLADFLVLTSDNARNEEPQRILEDILKGVDKEKPYCVIKDRERAIFYAIDAARAGDTVVLAGKGHEEYEIRGNLRLPFSEREIVRRALSKKAGGTREN